MASAASTSNNDDDRYNPPTWASSNFSNFLFAAIITITVFFFVFLNVFPPVATNQPQKLPEFSITSMNITNLDSNSSTAITVDLQVRNPTESNRYNIKYHIVHAYVVKDGRVIGEVSIPALGPEGSGGETMELKARFVVANGNGVGFRYWNADVDSAEGRVLHLDVWALTDGLQVTCQGVGVVFQKGAKVGVMVDAVKTCLLPC